MSCILHSFLERGVPLKEVEVEVEGGGGGGVGVAFNRHLSEGGSAFLSV